MVRWCRYAWAAPNSIVGLALAATACVDGRVAVVDGVVEAQGGALRWLLRRFVPLVGGAAALTLGHVVLAADEQALERTRAHERVHVRQYERWGPLFLAAYALASLLAVARGRHFYFDNRFEREARARQHAGPDREGPSPVRRPHGSWT